MRTPAVIYVLLVSLTASSSSAYQDQVADIDFNRDIRPILSDRCFLCHGPDQSGPEANHTDLRLDNREAALEYGVFDFDKVDASELLARVTSDDPDIQMPTPDSGKKSLSEDEVAVLRQWIQQGAKYAKHWAYVAPRRPEVPRMDTGKDRPVDAFVSRKLKQSGLKGAPLADRETLLRRVTYDLTGLPPTVREIDAFIEDTDPFEVAFERVVDRLLGSPQYGEHMARFWLDAARYADSSGYQYDRERKQWVWRDWVIHAFNSNMPFDEFTVHQLAGDMLDDATDQTILATGFNRNHPITIEGGVVDEEYRTEYVIDRVVTTSTVWMGQTLLCARCHDHKYDPISQKEFYEFYSFFNNVPERGLNGFDPKQKIASPLDAASQELKATLARSQAALDELHLPYADWEEAVGQYVPAWAVVSPDRVISSGGATVQRLDDQSILMGGKNPDKDDYTIEFVAADAVAAVRLEALVDPSLTNGSASRGSNGNFVLSEFVIEAKPPGAEKFSKVAISKASADYEQKNFTINLAHDGKVNSSGWAVDGNTKPEPRSAVFQTNAKIPAGTSVRVTMQHRYGRSHQIGRFRLSVSAKTPVDSKIDQLVAIGAEKRNSTQDRQLQASLIRRFGNDQAKQLLANVEQVRRQLEEAQDFPETLVMKEMESPRQAYVLERGEYDKPQKDHPVQSAVPKALGLLPDSTPRNRLGLAQWLVSREQPLTARVIVNRFWQRLFGVGLVKTSEDFGSQGEYPSHPELLDWLAVDFMESGWDVKGILKTIVMSRTYQQSSRITPEQLRIDPDNRLLSRGPRVRLDGEAIRDTALAVSGLLKARIGGPSVYPYHPKGLWLEINNRPNYSRAYPHQTDSAQHHRRTLYTYWKRTVPPPSIATFDAPSREYCIVRRSSTNTPLQAFVMLHDPQFVEAARGLAMRMLEEDGADLDAQITFGFRSCTGRRPKPDELEVLREIFNEQLDKYRSNPDDAQRLLSVGVVPVNPEVDQVELAAMTQVARTLMNLSEFLTKG